MKDNFSAKHKFLIFLTSCLNIIGSVAKVAAPAALAKAIEIYAKEQEKEDIFGLESRELIYLSIVLALWVKGENFFKDLLIKNIESVITRRHSSQLIKLIHDVSFQEHFRIMPDVPKILMDIISIQTRLTTEVLTVIHQVLLDIIIGTSMVWIHYGNFVGAGFLLYCLFDMWLLNALLSFFVRQEVRLEEINSTIHRYINREFEVLKNTQTIRIFNHQALETEISEEYLDQYLSLKNKYQLTDAIISLIKLIPYLITSLMLVFFVLKKDNLDDFIFLISYISILHTSLLRLNQSIKSSFQATQSIEGMNELIRKYTPHSLTLSTNLDPFMHMKINQLKNDTLLVQQSVSLPREPSGVFFSKPPEVTFEEVSFTFEDQCEPILSRINFTIGSGKRVGILGDSGVGKSTLINLMYGFYQFKGSIRINNRDIRDIPATVLSQIFSCVPQNMYFFQQPLKYNVLYGTLHEKLLKKYLKRDKIAKPVKMPKGYEQIREPEDSNTRQLLCAGDRLFSKVMKKAKLVHLDDERADQRQPMLLSGGEQQRLSIARALARPCHIMLLDEPTSALDEPTADIVMKDILETATEKKRSVFIITHRPSIIKDFDHIIFFKDRTIVEQGAPADLMKSKGPFYQQYGQQLL